jgi:predicted site-specific integrase-resolvase
MVFDILEKWSKDVRGETIYDFLDINRATWYRYKKKGELPLMVCKVICYEFGNHITDDLQEISLFVVERYYKEVV